MKGDISTFLTQSKTARDILIILTVGIFSLGLIFFTDYVIWDGWWHSHFTRNPNEFPYLARIFREVGRPLDILFFWPFVFTSHTVLVAKMTGVTGWIIAAFFQYDFLKRAASLTSEQSLAIVLISLSCPFFSLWGELSFNMYVFAVLSFWLAWSLTAKRIINYDEDRKSPALLRIVIAVVFVISFELNSNIAHLYSVGLFALILNKGSFKIADLAAKPLALAARYWELAILPVAYWAAKTFFTPTSGAYLNYNKVNLNLETLSEGYKLSLIYTSKYLKEVLGQSLGVSMTIAALIFFILISRMPVATVVFSEKLLDGRNVRLFAAGCILLLCSVFSYIVVGQPAVQEGWMARNTILMNLPFAAIMVSVLAFAVRRLFSGSPQLILFLLIFATTVGIIACNETILRWEAFGIKETAIQSALREIIVKENRNAVSNLENYNHLPVNVINLRDYYYIPKTISYYPPIIWTFLAAPDDAAPAVFVIETTQTIPDTIGKNASGKSVNTIRPLKVSPSDLVRLEESTTMNYALTGIPLAGRTKTIAILPGKLGYDGVDIGWTYLLAKYFGYGNPQQVKDDIVSVVDLDPSH